MKRASAMLAALAIGSAWTGSAQAQEADFGYSYGATTEEAGESEVEFWATDRRGKDDGHYGAQDYRIEYERGITDRFQASLYANFAGHHVHGLEPDFADVNRGLGFNGLSAEFQFNLAKPSRRGVGFTLYAEPGWARIDDVSGERSTEYELEFKTIVQKNFANDRLVWVGNLTLEPEWEQETAEPAAGPDEKDWAKELKVAVTTGLSYRLSRHWSAGLEGAYRSVYPDWTHGLHRAAYAVSAGPTVHVSAGEWGVTATWLPQLFGGPSRPGSDLSLNEYERQEFRLKLSHEF